MIKRDCEDLLTDYIVNMVLSTQILDVRFVTSQFNGRQ